MFDPLHKWLGIPPSEQPPNDYRLLGITNFESDSEVIDGAADKHLAFLHGLANGEHSVLAEELSNRIAAARLRLLNAKKKAAYDEELQQTLPSQPQNQGLGPGWPPSGTPPVGASPIGAAPMQPAPIGVAPLGQAPASQTPQREAPQNLAPQDQEPQQPSSAIAATTDGAPESPAIRQRNSAAHRSRRSVFSSWKYTVFPGAIALALLIGLIVSGRLQLDRDKMVAIGVPEEMAETLARTETQGGVAENSSTPQTETSSSNPGTQVDVPDNTSSTPMDGTNASGNRTETRPSNTQSPRPGNVGASVSRGPSGSSSNPLSRNNLSTNPNDASTKTNSGNMADLLQEREKPPVPAAVEIESKLKVVRSIYKEEYEAAKTKDEKLSLASKLLRVVDETEHDAAGQFALMRVVRDIYMNIHDYENAMATVDQMTDYFDDVDTVMLKSEPLALLNAIATGKSLQYLDAVFEVAHDSFEVGHVAAGRALLERAKDKLPSGIPSSREKEFASLSRDFQDAFLLKQGYDSGLASTASDSNETDAATAIGRYMCFVENRWDEGLGHLAKGSNNVLSAAAKIEKSRLPSESNEFELAEAWYAAASQSVGPLEKRRILDHAYNWYQRAEEDAKGLEAIQIERRLKEIQPQTTSARIASFQSSGGSSLRRPQRGRKQVRLLDQKTWDSTEYSVDFANISPGPIITLGMGAGGYYGETVAGLELENATKIGVTGGVVKKDNNSRSSRTRIGFFIDYHTPKGYSKRVFLEAVGSVAIGHTGKPDWGRGTVPDQVIPIDALSQYQFDLKNWAPPDWDGKSWFSIYMKDGGRERAVRAVVAWAP